MTETINVMEAIWQGSDKASDGCLHYPIEFIDFLWDMGFIDAGKYSKEAWRATFEPFKQSDSSYKLTHEEFLSLDKYRYQGEIRIPFDAFRINEGKYTDEGLDQLVKDSIRPSCGLEEQAFRKFIDELKGEFRQADDLILIKMPAKQKIKKLLEEYPSPLRRLELLFDNLLKQEGIQKEVEALEQKVTPVATPQQAAQVQASAFTMGVNTVAEMQAKRLKEISKAKPPKDLPEDTGGDPIKKVKRSPKGVRG